MAIAYCWRSGEIEFCSREGQIPFGALRLGKGPVKRLKNIVSVVARHAYDGKTLLVPGVPEAVSDGDANHAARAFLNSIDRRLTTKANQQVEG